MRCSNLCAKRKTFQSSCLMIINHTGQTIPIVCRIDGSPVKYDHIVCDVPCSGDETIRKNLNTGSNWHPDRGNNRFLLQLNIARRGLELSKVGGTWVYSSCMCQVKNSGSVVRLVSPSQKDILHKANNRLKIAFACSGVDRYVLKSSCFHLLPTSSTNGVVGGSIKDVKLLIGVRSVKFDNLLRDCQRMLWSSEIGWIRFLFPVQSWKIECLEYNDQYLQLPTSVQFEESRVYDLTTALSRGDTTQFPEIESWYTRRRRR